VRWGTQPLRVTGSQAGVATSCPSFTNNRPSRGPFAPSPLPCAAWNHNLLPSLAEVSPSMLFLGVVTN
jgi:hypothetical protein